MARSLTPARLASRSVRREGSRTWLTASKRTSPAGVSCRPPTLTRGASQRRKAWVTVPARIASATGFEMSTPHRGTRPRDSVGPWRRSERPSCSAAVVCSVPSRSACCARSSTPTSSPTSSSARRSVPSTALSSRQTRRRRSSSVSSGCGAARRRAARSTATACMRQAARAVRTRTHLHSASPLRQRIADELGDRTFADLAVPFQCCAASIERATEHWFTSGSVVDAVVASAAVPGLLPPAEVDGEHYLDGGIVNSIPLGRAVELGARAHLRAPGRPRREAADGADAALGGGSGVLRDRPAPPLRARARRRAGGRRGARHAHRQHG